LELGTQCRSCDLSVPGSIRSRGSSMLRFARPDKLTHLGPLGDYTSLLRSAR